MALTAEGRALTEAHRVAQASIGVQAGKHSSKLWSMLDRADIDLRRTEWLAAQTAMVTSMWQQSEALAAEYVGAYREVEARGANLPAPALGRPDLGKIVTDLDIKGPVRIKSLIGAGMDSSAAFKAAFVALTGAVQKQVMDGGRVLIGNSVESDSGAVGWRRVAQSGCCTFCAMLASRGPVYKSGQTTGDPDYDGTKYHDWCRCTAEIVYGEWKPTRDEQEYINTYFKAAQIAKSEDGVRTQETVLWRMRALGDFRDKSGRSPHRG